MATRDFTEGTLELLRKNVDESAFDLPALEDFSNNQDFTDFQITTLASDNQNLANYMRFFLDAQNVTKSKLEKIIADVHGVENQYAAKFSGRAEEGNTYLSILKKMTSGISDAGGFASTFDGKGFLQALALIPKSDMDDEYRYNPPMRALEPVQLAILREIYGEDADLSELLNPGSPDDLFYGKSISDIALFFLNSGRSFPLSSEQQRIMEEYRNRMAALGDPLFNSPTSYITSLYGWRNYNGFNMHRGLDISAPSGSSIISMWNGVVLEKGYNNDYGNYIIIQTIINGKPHNIVFMHMNTPSTWNQGDYIAPGSEIGQVGNTANPPVGIHLHIELRTSGGNTYGWDENHNPTSVNPSIALNPYYGHPSIMTPDKIENYREAHPEEELMLYDNDKYNKMVNSMNERRNNERTSEQDES